MRTSQSGPTHAVTLGPLQRTSVAGSASGSPADPLALGSQRYRLAVQCAYDSNWYPTGVKINHADFDAIALTRHEWHGDWNCTVDPIARTVYDDLTVSLTT